MTDSSLRNAIGNEAWTLLASSSSTSDLQAKLDSSSDQTNPAEKQPMRADAKYVGRYQRFLLAEKRYTQQFSHLYLQRLIALRPAMLVSAKKKWGDECVMVEKVIDLGSGDQGYVIGTLYKEQKHKPCILDEFTDEMAGKNLAVVRDNFASDDDSFILEDESGRVTLEGVQGDMVDRLVTGIVVGVKGKLMESGELRVDDLCFAGMAPSRNPNNAQAPVAATPATPEQAASSDNPRYMLLVSGLHAGSTNAAHDPSALVLLTDYITGHAGGKPDTDTQAAIARVVVCGNSLVRESTTGETGHFDEALSSAVQDRLVAPLKELDALLSEWASAVPVDILPGACDPGNMSLPQQQIHKCLFPEACRFSTFKRVTNPCNFSLEFDTDGNANGDDEKREVEVLGHSGQPLADILLNTRNNNALDLLCATLDWRHMAPTAPDTLPTYPLHEGDPFVLVNSPDVYFAGNCEEFATKLVVGGGGSAGVKRGLNTGNSGTSSNDYVQTRVVCVPDFSKTGEAVLVDLNSPHLECTKMVFRGVQGVVVADTPTSMDVDDK